MPKRYQHAARGNFVLLSAPNNHPCEISRRGHKQWKFTTIIIYSQFTARPDCGTHGEDIINNLP